MPSHRHTGKPRNIRIYDNKGETADRYTIVYTKPLKHHGRTYYAYYGASSRPFHPQGVGMYGELDKPYRKHKGEVEPSWASLPEDVKKLARQFAADMA